MSVPTHACTHTYTHIRRHARTYTHARTRTHIHAYTRTHTSKQTHRHTHAHTHTHVKPYEMIQRQLLPLSRGLLGSWRCTVSRKLHNGKEREGGPPKKAPVCRFTLRQRLSLTARDGEDTPRAAPPSTEHRPYWRRASISYDKGVEISSPLAAMLFSRSQTDRQTDRQNAGKPTRL